MRSPCLEPLRSAPTDTPREAIERQAGPRLSDREWQVLELLANGSSTRGAAERLAISDVTVRRHVGAVIRKLGAPDRAGAVRFVRDASRAGA